MGPIVSRYSRGGYRNTPNQRKEWTAGTRALTAMLLGESTPPGMIAKGIDKGEGGRSP